MSGPKRALQKYLMLVVILAAASLLVLKLYPNPVPVEGEVDEARLKIFVSVLPQKFFVERVGKDRVSVSVLVGPGQSPSTYEPLPKQMAALAESDIYFRIGVPFEIIWNEKIAALNPQLKIVDTRDGIQLRKIDGYTHDPAVQDQEVLDPHIWLDPLLVKIQAQTIFRELAVLDPLNEEYYFHNMQDFFRELDQLHQDLEEIFLTLDTDKLMVFHPAWGYLADRYGLKQIPIEIDGKEPGPRALAQLVDQAQEEKIKVIFLEEQSNAEAAASVARAVGGKVVKIDPLAEDYLSNLRHIASVIRQEIPGDF